jgi:secretion/DNA translocation related CpaE-like protein
VVPAEVVVVVGACGGVGASTVSALVARHRAARGRRAALVDLHHGGGGVDVLLGIEGRPGARWPDLQGVRGTVDPADLEGLLPSWEGVEVLSAGRSGGGPDASAVSAVLAGLAEGCSSVVVDLPAHALRRSVGEQDEASALLAGRSDLLLVVGQDVRGVSAALGLREGVGPGPAQLVLRARRPAHVSPLEVAHVLDLPLLAVLPDSSGLRSAADRGLGPLPSRWSRLGRAVRRVADGCGSG